ncbi:conserved hypothetical protein [Paecilomyces variotii No. 5]|uniref:Uncharacterized protein n=1 Tax=Byssochlamys spectabilis (strain No. 5 / NBRC 109023) TaxID=1356009 RepID=V5G2A5_BYSSN|nr:conserved hypothetical protein [Paecilomyces variotii No. 5]
MALSVTRKFQSDLATEDEYPLPRSPEDWKLALERIKVLYLRRQYKQCAARANELLEKSGGTVHSVHKTYIHFYIAICYEELGRAAHNYSKNKLQFLNLALENLTACSLILPKSIPVPEREEASPVDVDEYASSPSDISTIESIWSSIQCDREETPLESSILSEDDPFISPDSNSMKGIKPLKFKLSPMDMEESDLMPAPLRIRKRSSRTTSGDNTMNAAGPLQEPFIPETPMRSRPLPPLPLNINPVRRVFPVSLKTAPEAFSHEEQSSPLTPPSVESITRYNDHVSSFSSQLNATIANVNYLIASVTELQKLREASKIKRSSSFWSFTPVGSTSGSPPQARGLEETKQQRISRLRSEGWATVGLKSESRGWKGRDYYRDLCSEILDELYELN